MKTIARARAVGGSLVDTIPKEIVEEEDVHEGDLIEIEIKKPKQSFFGVAKDIGPFTEEDEMKAHE